MNYLGKSICFMYCFILFGCPDQADPLDSTLKIINDSSQNIVYKIEFNAVGDTSLQSFSFPLRPENINGRTINGNSQVSITDGYINALENNPNVILMVFLLSKDTIEQVSWEQITADYLVLQRYDLTLEDLEASNWTITYP